MVLHFRKTNSTKRLFGAYVCIVQHFIETANKHVLEDTLREPGSGGTC